MHSVICQHVHPVIVITVHNFKEKNENMSFSMSEIFCHILARIPCTSVMYGDI